MKLLILLILLNSYEVYASRVVTVMGEVYGKLNGQDEAILLKKDEEVKLNTLISTMDKSFIKIKFSDQSVFVVGPNSKIMLTQKDSEAPKVLNLVIGKLRAHVLEDQVIPEGYNHKLFIKTRSAIMGVRGTEFVVSYNDKNHTTSNITIKGEVDIYKKKDKEVIESIREIDNGDKDFDETIDLKDQLASYDVKRVTEGSFSSAKFNHDRPLEPVRVSPVQIDALKNSNFHSGKKVSKSGSKKKKKKTALQNKKYNRKTDEGYRHGGIVDLKTGLYVAPPENATFDEDKGVYEMPKELGEVDLTTGDYSPPKGILLDPTAGFVLDPLYYGDRNILENLKKMTMLAGPIDEQLEQAVLIFKHITRSDFYGFGDFKHTTSVLENYYGEYRNVTESPAFFLEGQGFGGMQLYHSKKYLVYLKGHLKANYFDSDNKLVQRNNMVEGMGGLEFNRKISVYGKEAKLIFDTEYRKQYMNHDMDDFILPYTDDISFRIKNVFSFNKDNHANLYYQIKYFQGFEEANHGKLHNVGFHHRLILGKEYDLLAGGDYSIRNNHGEDQFYRISRAHLKGVKKNFLYKTDFTFGGTHEWHESDTEYPFVKAMYKRAELHLNRRLGNFWKLNANYKYEDQEVDQDKDNRNFNRHIFSLGLMMYY